MICVLLAAALAASPTISLEHRGPLREGLQEIARKGGLNLVASGKLTQLDEEAVIHLKDIPAEEALTSVATAYGLQLTHQGNLWIVRPEVAPVAAVAPIPPVPPVPPIPPVPPVPPVAVKPMGAPPGETEAERAMAHAEAMRGEAEALRETAEELREAKRAEIEAAKEKARAEIEAARARQQGSEDDLVNMSGPVVVKANQRVDSAISYGGTVTVEQNARVDGDVVSFGGDVVLLENARVDGDAVSFGGRVEKKEGARVMGEEVSFGGKGLGSMVANKAVEVSRHPDAAAPSRGGGLAAFFAEFAVLFGLGFLLIMFAPQRMKTIEAELQSSPAKNGAAGLLALLCSVPLTLFLVVTLIGIPVAMAFWMLAGVCTVMGLVAVANVVGSRMPVPRLRRTQAVALAFGLLSMLVVARIPVLGPLLMSGAVFVSLGAIVRTRLGQRGQGMPVPSASFIDSTPSRPTY